MWSSAWAGSVITWTASHSTLSGAVPIARWIVGTSCSASQRIRVTPAWVSAQPPSESTYTNRGRRGLVISSWSQSSSIASPANAVPPPVLIPGTSGSGLLPSASSVTLLPNRAVAQRPPICLRPSVRIQQIGPSAYSYAAIEPEVSITSPTWGSSIGAVMWRVILHGWVVVGRPVWRCAWPRV